MTALSQEHIPVMLSEVISYLDPQETGYYVDGTFGRGGYTKALLEKGCRVLAIDRDPQAMESARALETIHGSRFSFRSGNFSDVDSMVPPEVLGRVQGFVLDLGVSSPQIDQPERGFSFQKEGPLDMRMDPHQPKSARDVVMTYDAQTLADIFYFLGEERHAHRVARAIVAHRAKASIDTTTQLAALIRSVVRPSRDGLDPATRSFQGLRIYVNQELDSLSRALDASLDLLAPGGRLVVVSFHSLEDRLVKAFIRRHSGRGSGESRHIMLPKTQAGGEDTPILTPLSKGVVRPSHEECRRNPRATSARLRAALMQGKQDRKEGGAPCPL